MTAVVLMDPKFPANVGDVRRSCACYGVGDLVVTGRRAALRLRSDPRVPRPLRMAAYDATTLATDDRPFERLTGHVFVAVEVRDNAETLPQFEHPENAAYVFGPEDGSLARQTLMQCQRFVTIPTLHCLNLATAVATVLYDRAAKRMAQ